MCMYHGAEMSDAMHELIICDIVRKAYSAVPLHMSESLLGDTCRQVKGSQQSSTVFFDGSDDR